MTAKEAADKGYSIMAASLFEVGLVFKGKGVRTWWSHSFGDLKGLPPLDHPIVMAAIEINEQHLGHGAAFARTTDPSTSHEAAEYMEDTERATKLENLVVVTLREHGRQTTHGICDITGLEWNSISPRIRPLIRKGLVRDSGEKEVAKTGRKCILWEAV